MGMDKQLHTLFVSVNVLVFSFFCGLPTVKSHVSAVGDPGMQRNGLRVAFEAWNFCNEVGQEAPHMGSPRAADCFDLSGMSFKAQNTFNLLFSCYLIHICFNSMLFPLSFGYPLTHIIYVLYLFFNFN